MEGSHLGTLLTVAIALAIGVAPPAASGDDPAYDEMSGPLDRLPPGWVWIPRYSPDSWRGAYHDAVSGAFVSFDVGAGPSPVAFWRDPKRRRSEDRYEAGRVGALRFEWLDLPDFRARVIASHRRDLGLDPSVVYPEPGSFEERLYPPEGVRHLKATLADGKRWWPFEAELCDATQERRIRELLLGADRVARGRVGGWRGPAAVLGPEARDTFAEEPTYEAFVRRYGQGGIQRTGCEVFSLSYPVRGPDDHAIEEWRISFDRERRFLAKDLRPR
jgi:hypothetical protein